MPARKLPPDNELIDLYRSGMSGGEIAERYNCLPKCVWARLTLIGEPRRSPQEATRLRGERGRTRPPCYWKGKKQPPAMVAKRAAKTTGPGNGRWIDGTCRQGYRSKVTKVKCVACGSRCNLAIHHKDFDHYNNAEENLEVLCVSCHIGLHKREYWQAKREGREPRRSNAPCHWPSRSAE